MAPSRNSAQIPRAVLEGTNATWAGGGVGRGPGWAEAVRRTTPAVYPIAATRIVATIDVLVVLGVFMAVVGGVNVDRMNGMQEFMAFRITLKNALVLCALVGGVLVAFPWVGLYDARRLRRWSDEVRRVVMGTTLVTAIATIAPLTSRGGGVDYWSLVWFWSGDRRRPGCRARNPRQPVQGPSEPRRVIIVGTGPHAQRSLSRALRRLS